MMSENRQRQTNHSSLRKNGKRCSAFFAFLLTTIFSLVYTQGAAAQGVADIVDNVVSSGALLPDLASVTIYILGLAFGLMGVVKIKEHVENPSQTPLRTGIVRLLVGGGFLAFPSIYQAMAVSINGGFFAAYLDNNSIAGATAAHRAGGLNQILTNILTAITTTPLIFSLFAYLASLLFAIQGLLKVKAHVESPDQNPLKDAVVKLLIGGAFASLPMVYSMMAESIAGFGGGSAVVGLDGFAASGYGKGCGDTTSGTLGTVICTLMGSIDSFPSFLDAIDYLAGLLMGFWGLLKIKEHVINPQNTPLSQGISRIAAGGAFFTLPFVVNAIKNSIAPGTTVDLITSFNGAGATTCGGGGLGGLDTYLYCAVSNIIGPLHIMVGFFAMIAGIIFIMIGISRLLKTEQDGPKGPSGMGTIMTFIIGGVLISFNQFIGILSTTLFSDSSSKTLAKLEYDTGIDPAEVLHVEMVIGAIIQFMIIVGLISFARGIFIIRGVSEGDNQSSMMAGVTHIIGGALAFNLGPLMNAVQVTLGITEFGITFS